MGDLLRKRRFAIAAILALLAGLTLYSRSLAGKAGGLNLFERGVMGVSYYPLKAVQASQRSVIWVWQHYFHLVGVREENDALRSLIRDVNNENTQLTEAALENERLRKLVGFGERTGLNTLAALVIGEDVRQEFRSILLDKGMRDGVRKDMAVVTAEGVVGRVIEIADRVSKVLLILDHKSAVPCLIQRSRAKAIVKGTGERVGALRLTYVARRDDVQEGDILITSGVGGIFPKGLVVGMVTSVSWEGRGMFKDAAAQPSVDFSRLEDVLILLDQGILSDLEEQRPAPSGEESASASAPAVAPPPAATPAPASTSTPNPTAKPTPAPTRKKEAQG